MPVTPVTQFRESIATQWIAEILRCNPEVTRLTRKELYGIFSDLSPLWGEPGPGGAVRLCFYKERRRFGGAGVGDSPTPHKWGYPRNGAENERSNAKCLIERNWIRWRIAAQLPL